MSADDDYSLGFEAGCDHQRNLQMDWNKVVTFLRSGTSDEVFNRELEVHWKTKPPAQAQHAALFRVLAAALEAGMSP